MRHDDIDRLLLEDDTVQPSREFAFRTMYAVRQETSRRQGIAFPWKRLALGLGACAAVTVAAIVAALLGGQPPAVDPATFLAAVEPFAPAVALLATTLAGSLAVVLGTLRLADRS